MCAEQLLVMWVQAASEFTTRLPDTGKQESQTFVVTTKWSNNIDLSDLRRYALPDAPMGLDPPPQALKVVEAALLNAATATCSMPGSSGVMAVGGLMGGGLGVVAGGMLGAMGAFGGGTMLREICEDGGKSITVFFHSPGNPELHAALGPGVEGLLGLTAGVAATQSGLSLVLDVSAAAFLEPGPLLNVLVLVLRFGVNEGGAGGVVTPKQLTSHQWSQALKVVRGLKVRGS